MLWAIFDLDGTLADVAWRRHWALAAMELIEGEVPEQEALDTFHEAWDTFHSLCMSDTPHTVECLLAKL